MNKIKTAHTDTQLKAPSEWALPIALIIPGLVAAAVQLYAGVDAMALSQQISWGLYIAGFFTAAGAGAGLLLLTGVGEFSNGFSRTNRLQMLSAVLACFVVAGLLIFLDLGVPIRSWMLTASFKLSLLGLDFWALMIAGVSALLYLLDVIRDGDANVRYVNFGVLAILSSLALLLVEGLMLASLAAHPMWNSMTVISFLLSAFIGSCALLTILLAKTEAGKTIRNWLSIGLVVSLIFSLSELLTGLTNASPRVHEESLSLLSGSASPYFWLQVIAGILIPLCLLWKTTDRLNILIGSLAILGILCEKLWVLVAGQETPWLPIPAGSYFPSAIELLVVITMTVLGIGIYKALQKLSAADAG